MAWPGSGALQGQRAGALNVIDGNCLPSGGGVLRALSIVTRLQLCFKVLFCIPLRNVSTPM